MLTGVSETLFIPLCARARETRRPDRIIRDDLAVEFDEKLQYDCSRFDWFWAAQVGVAVRTLILDGQTTEFLRRYPRAVVVNLGSGLCTRFNRLDNGSVIWFELDLPSVQEVRRTLVEESDRHRFLTGSVMDFSWIDAVKQAPAEGHLFIAEGLLMYFSVADVRHLLMELKRNFPDAELLIEAISPMLAATSWMHPLLSKTNARFAWGVESLKTLETWIPGLRLIDEWYLFDYYPRRWRFLSWLRWCNSYRRQMKIRQLQFAPCDQENWVEL